MPEESEAPRMSEAPTHPLDRIVAAITEHLEFTRECPCGEWVDSGPGRRRVQHNYAEHIAVAVLASLELRQEWTWSWPNGSAPGVPGYGFSVETREEAVAEADSYMTIVSRWVGSWRPENEEQQ